MSERRLTEEARDEAYRAVAQAVTEAGPAQESLYLARLALLLIEEIGDAVAVRRLIDAARVPARAES